MLQFVCDVFEILAPLFGARNILSELVKPLVRTAVKGSYFLSRSLTNPLTVLRPCLVEFRFIPSQDSRCFDVRFRHNSSQYLNHVDLPQIASKARSLRKRMPTCSKYATYTKDTHETGNRQSSVALSTP